MACIFPDVAVAMAVLPLFLMPLSEHSCAPLSSVPSLLAMLPAGLLCCHARWAAVLTSLVLVSMRCAVIFSGFFVNSDNLPAFFSWLSYLSPSKRVVLCC